MKKIVRGNDFKLRVPVMKIVDGAKVAFPLPGCTDIKVNVVNQYRRIALSYTIDVSEDNVLLARVEGDKVAVGTYALEVKGKIFGNDWRSNEYEQFQIVDNNAAGDTVFEPQEGEDSVEMDTALVVLAPSVELGNLIKDAEETIADTKEALKGVETKMGDIEQRADTAIGAATTAAENANTQAFAAVQSATRANTATERAEQTNAAVKTAEQARMEAEKDRKRAEVLRVQAEKERVAAEKKRASDTNEAIQAAKDATAGAEKVNATLGYDKVLSITDRNGTTNILDISAVDDAATAANNANSAANAASDAASKADAASDEITKYMDIVKLPVVETPASGDTVVMEANKVYVITVSESLTLTLTPPTDTTICNEYQGSFDTGDVTVEIVWPENVIWGDDPVVETNTHYEFSIRYVMGKYYGVLYGWSIDS